MKKTSVVRAIAVCAIAVCALGILLPSLAQDGLVKRVYLPVLTRGNPGQIAAERDRKICIVNLSGSVQWCFPTQQYDYSAHRNPTWSPDGAKIAFEFWDDPYGIYVADADGSNPVSLTTAYRDEQPAWSPDGTKIAFASQRDGQWDIYVMNADGSNQTRLTYGPDG